MQGCPPVLEGVNEWAGFWKASIEALRKGNGVSTSLTSRVFKEPAGFLFFLCTIRYRAFEICNETLAYA